MQSFVGMGVVPILNDTASHSYQVSVDFFEETLLNWL